MSDKSPTLHVEMNFEILTAPITSTMKLLWHLIAGGICRPGELAAKLDMQRRQIHDALNRMEDLELIVKEKYGTYGVKCAVDRTVEDSKCAVDRTVEETPKCAVDRTVEEPKSAKCAVDRTVDEPVIRQPEEKCAADRTVEAAKCAVHRTLEAESEPKCAVDRTLGPKPGDNIIFFLKDRILKDKKDFSISFEEIMDVFPWHDAEIADYRLKVQRHLREKNVSPDLVDRITVGMVLHLPGFEVERVSAIFKEADQLCKADKVRHRWIHVAKYVKEVYTALGLEWTPCRKARECEIEQKVREARGNAERIYAQSKPANVPADETLEQYNKRTGHRCSTPLGKMMCEILDAVKENDPKKIKESLGHG